MKTAFALGVYNLAKVALCVMGGATALYGDVIAQGAFLTATNHVASGSEMAEGRVLSGTDGEVWKTGVGTWTVLQNAFDAIGESKVVVADGKLRIADAGAVSAATLPQSVRDKAFFWVDAEDPDASHFARSAADASQIERWYDVRETSVETRRYPMAGTKNGAWAGYEALPVLKTVTLDNSVQKPERAVSGVYFNGYPTGTRMLWIAPDGTDATVPVRHFFVVHAVNASWSSLIGNYDKNVASSWESPYLAPASESAAESLSRPYFAGGRNSFMRNGRSYLDGIRIDGTTETVRKGLHLLEAECSGFAGFSADQGCNAFFADNNRSVEWWINAGGDYICEALIFTNRLTAVERVSVQEYLAHKWGLPCAGDARTDVSLAEGSELEVTDGIGLPVAVRGAGTVVKTGAGTFVNRGAGDSLSAMAALDVREGAVVLKRQSALSVSSGKSLSMSVTSDGVAVVSGAAPLDEATVSAGSPVVIAKVDESVKKLRVTAGEVSFAATGRGPQVAVASPDEVFIPNHSFEDWNEDGYYEKQGGFNQDLEGYRTYRGWTLDTRGSCFWLDFERAGFTDPLEGVYGTSRSSWPFSIPPPDGKRALVLHLKGSFVYTTVTVPETGDYEFSVRLSSREHEDFRNAILSVALTDDADNTVVDFGFARWGGEMEYRQHILTAHVPAGTYRLRLKLMGDEAYTEASPSNYECILDDLHLRRVPWTESVARRPVPNGDFERAKTFAGLDAWKFTQANTLEGWTVSNPDGWEPMAGFGGETIDCAAGFVTPSMRRVWSDVLGDVFNASRSPRGGDVELYFHGNGSSASTTFVPEAGRHYVEAALASGGTPGGSVEAFLTQGGERTSLGRLTPVSRLMAVRTWPVAFETDGTEEVTLSFVYSGEAGQSLWLDDIALADAFADETELVRNGDFERAGEGWTIDSPTIEDVQHACSVRNYVDTQVVFGADFRSGERFAEITGSGGFLQTVAIPRRQAMV